jgi:hypothetical protein
MVFRISSIPLRLSRRQGIGNREQGIVGCGCTGFAAVGRE